jgi:hypothetical protein
MLALGFALLPGLGLSIVLCAPFLLALRFALLRVRRSAAPAR